jgi:predicted nuclease with TOPRIM domain
MLNCKNSEGISIKEKYYHLTKLEQAIVFILNNHEERIQENTQAISNLEKENKMLKDNYNKLLEEINKLKQKNQDFTI